MSDDARPRDADAPQAAPLPLWQNLLQHDLVATLVVFMVGIPLSAGITQASDTPILANSIAAAIADSFGGLPATGIIVRSSASIASGGKTRWYRPHTSRRCCPFLEAPLS